MSDARHLIDTVLPKYDIQAQYRLVMPGPPSAVFRATKELTAQDIPLLLPLMTLRSLPNRLMGRGGGIVPDQQLLPQFLKFGFLDLGQRPDREIVIGCVGQFWKIVGNDQLVSLPNCEAFQAFCNPGFVKVAMNFLLEPQDSGTLVSTETRIQATDAVAQKRFDRYWRVIGFGSGAIRRSWLKAIRRRVQDKAY